MMAFPLQAGTFPAQSAFSSGQADNERKSDGRDSPIVGMWVVNLYVGTTTQLYDRVIEQFSSDGSWKRLLRRLEGER